MSFGKVKPDKLWNLVSKYVRLRDQWCQKCGKTGRLEAAHFFKRNHQATRYDDRNCVSLCLECHQWFDEHRTEFAVWFKEHIGEEEFDLLEGRFRMNTAPDKAGLALYFKQKIKELE